MIRKYIGNRIQEYRQKKGYTQEKFAEIVQITPNYLSAVERGVKTPSVETLIKIINALKVSADLILVDVITVGYKIKSSIITDKINSLPQEDQKRIFTVVDALVNDAKTK